MSCWKRIVKFNTDWHVSTRIKTLIFGEIFLTYFSSYCFLPDIGLFALDVVTDWVNGSNLIINGDLIWGGLMVSLPFLPMTIMMLNFAFLGFAQAWCLGLLALIFVLPAAVLATPCYMVIVLFGGILKLYAPLYEDAEDIMRGPIAGCWQDFKDSPVDLRMFEMVGESYPQALLGESIFTTWPYLH